MSVARQQTTAGQHLTNYAIGEASAHRCHGAGRSHHRSAWHVTRQTCQLVLPSANWQTQLCQLETKWLHHCDAAPDCTTAAPSERDSGRVLGSTSSLSHWLPALTTNGFLESPVLMKSCSCRSEPLNVLCQCQSNAFKQTIGVEYTGADLQRQVLSDADEINTPAAAWWPLLV